MVFPEVIHGKFVDLRSITPDDAEFSYNIRADKRNCETVGQLAASVEAQRKFIEWQMQEPNDYYFVVLNKQGEKIGLFGVYDIHGDTAEVGREVNIGEPTEKMEAEQLVNDFCRNVLNLRRTLGVVYSNNKRHLRDVMKVAKYIKTVQRGKHEALCFEFDLIKENETTLKVRRMLDYLYQKRVRTDSV